jgi:CDP-diacylglycerol---glycerol-3-phosphate 3-phosphatidyltransferase
LGVVLAYIAVIGSLLVSYARARAEGLGIKIREGLMTRFERLAVLIVGLIIGQLWIALWILAIMSVFTAFQRMYIVWSVLKTQNADPSANSPKREG